MTPDERPFDERLAGRVREVFDAYEEPVDEAALARMRAALGHGASRGPQPAGDRPPVAGGRRARWGAPAALLALLLVGSVGLWMLQTRTPEGPVVAEAVAPPAAPPDRPAPASGPAVAEAPADVAPPVAMGDAPATMGDVPNDESAALPPAAPVGSAPPREVAPPVPPVQPPPVRPADEAPVGIAEAAGTPTPDDATRPEVEARSETSPAVAALPPAPSVFDRADRPAAPPLAQPRSPNPVDVRAEASGVRLVVSTASAFAEDGSIEGAGVAAGVVREWEVIPRVSVSGGAVAAYGRFVVEPNVTADLTFFDELAQSPGQPVERVAQSTLTTLAVEVPLDAAVAVARAPGGRLSASLGLTSALYLAQTFRDEGRTYAGFTSGGPTPSSEEDLLSLPSVPYEARETVGPLGRFDLGRQLNLGVGYVADRGAFPVSVDVFARLPLGGVTSRDLPLTTVGVRLRYTLW